MSSIEKILADPHSEVRGALLQNIGEVIHIFSDDGDGPPQILLDFFLNRLRSPQSPDVQAAPRRRTLLSGPSLLDDECLESTFGWPVGDMYRSFKTAYSFPAVALTLGSSRWHEISNLHTNLCAHQQNAVRRCLAASLHEIAGIVGPESVVDSVSVPLRLFLNDEPNICSQALEHIATTLSAFSERHAQVHLQELPKLWINTLASWRVRSVNLIHQEKALAHDSKERDWHNKYPA